MVVMHLSIATVFEVIHELVFTLTNDSVIGLQLVISLNHKYIHNLSHC